MIQPPFNKALHGWRPYRPPFISRIQFKKHYGNNKYNHKELEIKRTREALSRISDQGFAMLEKWRQEALNRRGK